MELDNGKTNFQFSETEIPLRFPFQIIQNQQVIFDNRPCNRQDLSQYQMFIYTKNVLKDKKFNFNQKFIRKDQMGHVKWIVIFDCQIKSLFVIDDADLNDANFCFQSLVGIDLSYNRISELDAISHLINIKMAPKLQYLELKGNPISLMKNSKLIKKILSINHYRLKYLRQEGQDYDLNELLECIDQLSKLDVEIKTGKIDKKVGLELFMIRI